MGPPREASRVLLVEDDPRLAELVSTYLSGRGFEVEIAADGASARAMLARAGFHRGYAVVLLDAMLPDADGFDLCREFRTESATLPIVMITARGEETDRIVGLELGADDYLPKPFNPRELLARMKSLLRRTEAVASSAASMASEALGSAETRTFGRLEIDRARREVRLGGTPRRLTGHQFDLLAALAERAGRVVTRDQLMHAVRDTPLEAFDRSIDVHISRIRAAIEDDPKKPKRIQTIRGAGYLFASTQD